jgi:ABC-2 type transport system permease protein
MRRAFNVFKILTLTNIKSPSTLFWMMIFPILLLFILGSVFSSIQKSVTVRVAVVNESATFKGTNSDFSSYITKVLMEMSHSKDGKNPILYLKMGTDDESLEKFLSSLKNEEIDALMVIPRNFNSYVYSQMLGLPLKIKPTISIYTRKNSQSSDIAFSILNSVISSFNKSFWEKEKKTFISPKVEYVTQNGRAFSYIDFLTAGIIIMAFMSVSLFGITDDLLVQREKKVLRRFFVSPLTKAHYIFGMSFSNIFLEIFQMTLILIVGIALGAHLEINIASISFLLFSLVVSMPFGFFVASISKSANSGNALANLFNFVFMFLGGLFFPVNNVPFAIKAIAYSIPTTYLANGLRAVMGLSYSTTPLFLNILVPLAWALFMLFYSVRHFRWEV